MELGQLGISKGSVFPSRERHQRLYEVHTGVQSDGSTRIAIIPHAPSCSHVGAGAGVKGRPHPFSRKVAARLLLRNRVLLRVIVLHACIPNLHTGATSARP